MAGPVMEFWFEFDNAFHTEIGQVSAEIADAEGAVGPVTGLWRQHRGLGTYPEGFAAAVRPVTSELLLLAEAQLAIMDRHFSGDAAAEQVAFEEFGQGIHFDPRRPVTDKVHKMDRAANGSTGGYHVWHAFIRAAVLVGADAQRWLDLDRLVGLAWAIQTVAMPRQDASDNPRLPEARLQGLREVWPPMSVEQLDKAFDSRPFPPAALIDPAP
jgi:hypothetical protein